MPAIHGTRRAEELDAHATSAGLDYGLAKLSVIVPRRGSRRGTGPVGGGTTRSFVHVWSFAYPASTRPWPRGCIDGWPNARPVVCCWCSSTSPSGASSLGWRPTLARCRRAAKARQAVIGMHDVAEHRYDMPKPNTSEFASLLNIAHLHV